MYSRPATHSGSWYSGSKSALTRQLDKNFQNNQYDVIKGARLLIGPHAGFTFSGDRLAETFKVWDLTHCERIFILGPSHHVYFKNFAMISDYESYDTPIGGLPIDVDVNKKLSNLTNDKGKPLFKYMSEQADQDEHSFEMHCPFIRYRLDKSSISPLPKLVPIMIGSMDTQTSDDIVNLLLPYFKDEKNTFIISSDFCHWGSRFGYTEYLPNKINLSNPLKIDINQLELKTLSSFLTLSGDNEIYQSIEYLDKLAMGIASKGDYTHWEKYIKLTGNTICGQKPIYLILKLLLASNLEGRFNWLGYSQSSQVEDYFDSSVSYASGYVCS